MFSYGIEVLQWGITKNESTNLGGRRKIRQEGKTTEKIREEGGNLGKIG